MNAYLHAGKAQVSVGDDTLVDELVNAADVVICEADTADDMLAAGFERWRCPIKVAITPYGLTGPKRNWRATPATMLAAGGYTNLLGDADKAPLSLPGHYVEFQSGALAYAAAGAALFAGATNVAAEVSWLETVMALSQFTTVRWHCAGEIRSRHGSDFWFVAPSDLFRCSDGWVYVNIVPSFWDAFVLFLDLPELLLDERFADNDGRMTHRQALYPRIAEALAARTKTELETRAADFRVPVGVVRTMADTLAEPHLEARDFWETVSEGNRTYRSPGLPYRIDDAPRPALTVAHSDG